MSSWLQAYRSWEENMALPDARVLIGEATSSNKVLHNFDFGDWRSILHIAIDRNHLTIVKCLLKELNLQSMVDLLNVKDINDRTAIDYATEYGYHDLITAILSTIRDAGVSPLQLLQTPVRGGDTVAHVAARNNKGQVMDSMLDSLTDSNERLELLMTKDTSGLTVFHLVVMNNSVETVRDILNFIEADHMLELMMVQSDYYRHTVMHYAGNSNNYALVKTLVNHLTDEQLLKLLCLRSIGGYTAIKHATKQGHTQVVEFLQGKVTTSTIAFKIKLIQTSSEEEGRPLSSNIDCIVTMLSRTIP